jgi:hypothetical protein
MRKETDMTTKRGPKTLVINGVKCERVQEPMVLKGLTWDTYQPVDEGDFRIFERAVETKRIIQTMGN